MSLYRGIPQQGIKKELGYVYNDLNNPYLAGARATGFEPDPSFSPSLRGFSRADQGYSAKNAPPELMAEAIRAYMTDLKTVAPKTAAAIRDAINSHHWLSKIIQFNRVAGLPSLPFLRKSEDAVDPGGQPIPTQLAPILGQE
jgi:hypothetical protein